MTQELTARLPWQFLDNYTDRYCRRRAGRSKYGSADSFTLSFNCTFRVLVCATQLVTFLYNVYRTVPWYLTRGATNRPSGRARPLVRGRGGSPLRAVGILIDGLTNSFQRGDSRSPACTACRAACPAARPTSRVVATLHLVHVPQRRSIDNVNAGMHHAVTSQGLDGQWHAASEHLLIRRALGARIACVSSHGLC